MKLCGIIAEYNPFHNGHILHIQKAREITKADGMIAVISGNFTQRGDVSVIDKFKKTEAALLHGVDLVIELPYPYVAQNASIFGKASVELLKMLQVDDIVFGSETNNLEELKEIASLSINVDHMKEIMKDGISYPKAYGLLSSELFPNDILAISYLKALEGSDIKAHSIQRTNHYHGLEIEEIASASAIRKALQEENPSYRMTTPVNIETPHFTRDLYPYLRTLLLTSDVKNLKDNHLVSEGIEYGFIKSAMKYDDYDDFVQSLVSRRYTRARIQRTLLQIMMQLKKEEASSLPPLNYARILGFNQKGQEILRELKKKEVPLVTQFKKIPEPYKTIEWRSDLLYASLLSSKEREHFLKKELKGPVQIGL